MTEIWITRHNEKITHTQSHFFHDCPSSVCLVRQTWSVLAVWCDHLTCMCEIAVQLGHIGPLIAKQQAKEHSTVCRDKTWHHSASGKSAFLSSLFSSKYFHWALGQMWNSFQNGKHKASDAVFCCCNSIFHSVFSSDEILQAAVEQKTMSN